MSGVLVAGGAVAALFATTLSGQSAPSVTEVPSEKITVGIETINGSGCRAGTAAVAAAEDNTAFTVTYSDFLAETGPQSPATAFRKNCQLSLVVNIPQGFTYAIASVDYRGYAYLERGASALQKASYYFQGSSQTTAQETTYNGPFDDNWRNTDSTEMAELIYAPCGEQRNVNVNTELRVYPGSSSRRETSFITMDSTDGAVSTTYHMSWKECPSS